MNSSSAAIPFFRAARWLGAVLLVVTCALLFVLPGPGHAGALAPGFRTPMVAFEFARSHTEIEALFGPAGSELRAELVRKMDLGNEIDFLFMAVYAAFLSCIGLGVARAHGQRYLLVSLLAPVAALCDVGENIQLLTVTGVLAGPGGAYDASLARLAVFTWLKWGTLAFCMAWLSPALLRGTRTERVVGALGILVAALAVGAFFARATFTETFTLSLSLSFVGLWVVALKRVTL